MGLAYAGTRRENISELLLPMVADTDTPLDVCVFAGLALGLVLIPLTYNFRCLWALAMKILLKFYPTNY